jgi:hypothetical protein
MAALRAEFPDFSVLWGFRRFRPSGRVPVLPVAQLGAFAIAAKMRREGLPVAERYRLVRASTEADPFMRVGQVHGRRLVRLEVKSAEPVDDAGQQRAGGLSDHGVATGPDGGDGVPKPTGGVEF